MCVPPASLLDVHIWPEPKSIATGSSTVFVDHKGLQFISNCTHQDLLNSFERFKKNTFTHPAAVPTKTPVITIIDVKIVNPNAELVMGHDETYKLDILADGSAIAIVANTIFGAYYALEVEI